MNISKYLVLTLAFGQSATAMEPEMYSDPRAMSSGARQFIRERFADLNKELQEKTAQLNRVQEQSQKELANLHTSNSVLSREAREQFEKSLADKQCEYNSERESIIKHYNDRLTQEQARSEHAFARFNQLRESSFMSHQDTLGHIMREDYNTSLAKTRAHLEREKIAYTSGSLAGTAMSLKGLVSLSALASVVSAQGLGMQRMVSFIEKLRDNGLFAEISFVIEHILHLRPAMRNAHDLTKIAIVLSAPIALTTLGYLAKKKCDNQKDTIQRQLITLARHSLPVATVPLCLEPVVQKNESVRKIRNDELHDALESQSLALGDAAYYFADAATATLDTYSI